MSGLIDLRNWKRREHYELFRGISHPFFSVCVEVDASRLRERCRDGKQSFLLASLYLLNRAANDTEAFRLRMRDDGVWMHDRVRTSTTIMRSDHTFNFAVFEPASSFREFEQRGRVEIERARTTRELLLPEPGADDLVYHSTLPWLRFTSFTNAIDVGADSVPRVVFGRCYDHGGRWTMPVAVEVHHALVDGLDVARFLERFESSLDSAKL